MIGKKDEFILEITENEESQLSKDLENIDLRPGRSVSKSRQNKTNLSNN
jgi:hypothetical protein